MKSNKKLEFLQNLIQKFSRFPQEILEFDDVKDEDNYFSAIHQRKIDKIYDQSLEIVKELKSIRREIQQKIVNEEKKEKMGVLAKETEYPTLSFMENLKD
jgi:hypothetical protein